MNSFHSFDNYLFKNCVNNSLFFIYLRNQNAENLQRFKKKLRSITTFDVIKQKVFIKSIFTDRFYFQTKKYQIIFYVSN